MEAKEEEKPSSKNDTNTTVGNKTKKAKEEEEEWEYETVERKKTVQKTYNLKLSQSEAWHLRERLTGPKLEQVQKLLHQFEIEEDRRKKLAESRNKL